MGGGGGGTGACCVGGAGTDPDCIEGGDASVSGCDVFEGGKLGFFFEGFLSIGGGAGFVVLEGTAGGLRAAGRLAWDCKGVFGGGFLIDLERRTP